jgi:hypothetical protein
MNRGLIDVRVISLKPRETSVRIASVPTEIRTEHLQIRVTGLERNRHANPLVFIISHKLFGSLTRLTFTTNHDSPEYIFTTELLNSCSSSIYICSLKSR